jgi:hypothetical protein
MSFYWWWIIRSRCTALFGFALAMWAPSDYCEPWDYCGIFLVVGFVVCAVGIEDGLGRFQRERVLAALRERLGAD